MICVSGARECDGCGRCFPDSPIYTCPACGEELDATDTVYRVRILYQQKTGLRGYGGLNYDDD